jgi:riboflavin synthase
MFSGIVEGKARVRKVEKAGGNVRLAIDFGRAATKIRNGDSVSINGICLSVVSRKGAVLSFDAIAETLRKTNIGELVPGSSVNYETSMSSADLIGGHLVTGHVDGTGTIVETDDEDGSMKMVISVPSSIGSMVMEKGLIAVDGISLTPANVSDNRFTLYLIPDTLKKTTIAAKKPGERVNIELDIFGKYIDRYVRKYMSGRRGKKAAAL